MKSLFPKRLSGHIFQMDFLLKTVEIEYTCGSMEQFSSKSLPIIVRSASEYCVYFQNALYLLAG